MKALKIFIDPKDIISFDEESGFLFLNAERHNSVLYFESCFFNSKESRFIYPKNVKVKALKIGQNGGMTLK